MMRSQWRFLFWTWLLALSVHLIEAQIEFECPESDGLFAHPEQCDRYFECRNNRVTRKLCADGLVFDPQKTGTDQDPCDHLQNTKHKCRGRPKLQRPKPGDGFCPRQNGVFPSPDPSDCDKFYSCLNGVGSVQQCADGLHYDDEIGTCVWARESNRKGCLSDNQRATKSKSRQKMRSRNESPQEERRGGESLSNGFTCPGGKLGIHPALPHPTSCRLYYVCLNGVTPNEAGCGNGLVFNSETEKCDSPENVPGCEDTYSVSLKKFDNDLTKKFIASGAFLAKIVFACAFLTKPT